MGSSFPSPDRRLSRTVEADLAPIFHGLPLAVGAHEAPLTLVLAPPRARAAPAMRGGLALAAFALLALCGAAFTPGLLQDAAARGPSPEVSAALPVVQPQAAPAEAEAEAEDAPPAVLTPAHLVVAPPRAQEVRRPSPRRAVHRAAAKHAARGFDWSVYERKTRPRFADTASQDALAGLY